MLSHNHVKFGPPMVLWRHRKKICHLFREDIVKKPRDLVGGVPPTSHYITKINVPSSYGKGYVVRGNPGHSPKPSLKHSLNRSRRHSLKPPRGVIRNIPEVFPKALPKAFMSYSQRTFPNDSLGYSTKRSQKHSPFPVPVLKILFCVLKITDILRN